MAATATTITMELYQQRGFKLDSVLLILGRHPPFQTNQSTRVT